MRGPAALDEDGDDDSDGSLAVVSQPFASQSTHRARTQHALIQAPTPAFTISTKRSFDWRFEFAG